MEKIFASPNPGEISELRFVLENAGIVCLMRNEISASLFPEVPMSECTPELWIRDDEFLAKALELKRTWQSAEPVTGSNWVCLQCGETCEPQFTSCWKCGAASFCPAHL